MAATDTKEATIDAALLERVRQGDGDAFQQLYFRYYKPLYGFLLKLTRSASDSEDIVQETFTRLWKMRERIETEKNVKILIFIIARHLSVDMHRTRAKMASSSLDEALELGVWNQTPLHIIEEREKSLLIDQVISNMSPKQREIFKLYYYENLSHTEIAERLMLSYDNVRKQVYKGNIRLQEVVTLMLAFLMA